ncbi:UbiX family flavin prenyltransferase [bacterium]|nr:UbiX family flavin prenyltransferase [bacterium]
MKRITLAITGASGAIYSLRTLRALLICGCHVDLIVSDYGWMLLKDEAGFDGKRSDLRSFLADAYGQAVEAGELEQHNFHDLASPLASGSVRSDGMVVVPCTMKALAGVAHGSSGNLIERAADVALKERRTLILVPREAPFNLIHLRNLLAAAEAGAIILPAMPAFYQKPRTFDDLADFIAGRVLNLLQIPHELFKPWRSEPE